MPLYEWECLACEITFEDLASVSDGQVERACPNCGRMSPRVVSTFAIASGGSSQPQLAANAATPASGAKPPICLRYPHIPLLCHMDQPTAERAVAYAHGRGAEYDDKRGTREELRKKRGLPPPPPPAPPPHAHGHNPRRHQAASDGPLAKPASHDHGRKDAAHGHDHAAGSHTHSKDRKDVKSSGAALDH